MVARSFSPWGKAVVTSEPPGGRTNSSWPDRVLLAKLVRPPGGVSVLAQSQALKGLATIACPPGEDQDGGKTSHDPCGMLPALGKHDLRER